MRLVALIVACLTFVPGQAVMAQAATTAEAMCRNRAHLEGQAAQLQAERAEVAQLEAQTRHLRSLQCSTTLNQTQCVETTPPVGGFSVGWAGRTAYHQTYRAVYDHCMQVNAPPTSLPPPPTPPVSSPVHRKESSGGAPAPSALLDTQASVASYGVPLNRDAPLESGEWRMSSSRQHGQQLVTLSLRDPSASGVIEFVCNESRRIAIVRIAVPHLNTPPRRIHMQFISNNGEATHSFYFDAEVADGIASATSWESREVAYMFNVLGGEYKDVWFALTDAAGEGEAVLHSGSVSAAGLNHVSRGLPQCT